MLNSQSISIPRFAMIVGISVSGLGVNSAFAQRYYTLPSAPAYTQVMPTAYRKPMWPGPDNPQSLRTGMAQPTFTSVSQPMMTYIQLASGTAPIYAPPPTTNLPPSSMPVMSVPPQNPWTGVPTSVSPSNTWPVYYSTAPCPQCNEGYGGESCDWLCQSQKKLRSVFRASQRRSDCHFEYPVVTPTGSPYGYVEPTWNEFCADSAASIIGPGY